MKVYLSLTLVAALVSGCAAMPSAAPGEPGMAYPSPSVSTSEVENTVRQALKDGDSAWQSAPSVRMVADSQIRPLAPLAASGHLKHAQVVQSLEKRKSALTDKATLASIDAFLHALAKDKDADGPQLAANIDALASAINEVAAEAMVGHSALDRVLPRE